MENEWSNDTEDVLEKIRQNSVILAKQHKHQYFNLKSYIKYFRIPNIILAGINSVIAVGLSLYVHQDIVSGLNCLISLIMGVITSVELFLSIQTSLEKELVNSKDFYILSIDIYKILSLERSNRNVKGVVFLDEKFAIYQKLCEHSNLLQGKIKDSLAPLPEFLSSSKLSQGSSSSNTNLESEEGSNENNIIV